MNKSTVRFITVAMGVIALGAGRARASTSYSYVTDVPQISLQPGQTGSVKLYLLETLSAGSSSIINTDGGLSRASLRIRREPSAPAGSATLGALTYNSTDFSGASMPPAGGVQSPTEIAFTETGPLVGDSPKTGNSGGNPANVRQGAVYLGSVQVIGGTNPHVSTTFNLVRFNPTVTTGS